MNRINPFLNMQQRGISSPFQSAMKPEGQGPQFGSNGGSNPFASGMGVALGGATGGASRTQTPGAIGGASGVSAPGGIRGTGGTEGVGSLGQVNNPRFNGQQELASMSFGNVNRGNELRPVNQGDGFNGGQMGRFMDLSA